MAKLRIPANFYDTSAMRSESTGPAPLAEKETSPTTLGGHTPSSPGRLNFYSTMNGKNSSSSSLQSPGKLSAHSSSAMHQNVHLQHKKAGSPKNSPAAESPLFGGRGTHDVDGWVCGKEEKSPQGRVVWKYSFDKSGHLTEAWRNGTLVEKYEYTKQGARIKDHRSHTREFRDFVYDQEGRLTAAGGCCFTWTATGSLRTMEKDGRKTSFRYGDDTRLDKATLPTGEIIRYAYGHELMPVQIIRNGRSVLEFGWKNTLCLARFQDARDNIVYTFQYSEGERLPKQATLHGAEGIMQRITGCSNAHLTLNVYTDQVGSVRMLATPENKVVKYIEYDNFGNVTFDSRPEFYFPLGFAGGMVDPFTQFIRFGYRDYDPNVGRFTTKDPLGDTGGDHDPWDYCVDDPVSKVDPEGLKPKSIDNSPKIDWIGTGLKYLNLRTEPTLPPSFLVSSSTSAVPQAPRSQLPADLMQNSSPSRVTLPPTADLQEDSAARAFAKNGTHSVAATSWAQKEFNALSNRGVALIPKKANILDLINHTLHNSGLGKAIHGSRDQRVSQEDLEEARWYEKPLMYGASLAADAPIDLSAFVVGNALGGPTAGAAAAGTATGVINKWADNRIDGEGDLQDIAIAGLIDGTGNAAGAKAFALTKTVAKPILKKTGESLKNTKILTSVADKVEGWSPFNYAGRKTMGKPLAVGGKWGIEKLIKNESGVIGKSATGSILDATKSSSSSEKLPVLERHKKYLESNLSGELESKGMEEVRDVIATMTRRMAAPPRGTKLHWGRVSGEEAAKLRPHGGLPNMAGYTHTIELDRFNHTRETRQSRNISAMSDQIPLTVEDAERIPSILKNGTPVQQAVTKEGKRLLLFLGQEGGYEVSVVVEVRPGTKELAFIDMWKEVGHKGSKEETAKAKMQSTIERYFRCSSSDLI